jgi:rhodanese-related sulfurtransferase
MKATELKSRLDRGDNLVLIDVREPQEWAFNRIEGARHIPLRTLPQRVPDLDPASEIVVYCHHGMRSAQAAGYLAGQGFESVHNLEGGIDAWSAAVDGNVPRY